MSMPHRIVYTVRAYLAAKRATIRRAGLRRGLTARVRIRWKQPPATSEENR